MLKKISILVSLILVIILSMLQIDDELLPEATQWVEQVNVNSESQAYYYLMGIFAKSDENPQAIGLKRYREIRDWQNNSTINTSNPGLEDYPETQQN